MNHTPDPWHPAPGPSPFADAARRTSTSPHPPNGTPKFGPRPPDSPRWRADPRSALPPVMQGFYFRKRRDRLNWRLLASVQVDRIMKEVDIGCLQEIMENITYCDVEAEDLRYVDPNFIKLFQLSQLMVEYLLHSQDYLAGERLLLAENLETVGKKLEVTLGEHEKQSADLGTLKKELRAVKKTLYVYQLMARVPGGLGSNAGPSVASYHRCPHCAKTFSSQQFLENHLQRRHVEVMCVGAPVPVVTYVPQQLQPQSARLADSEKSLRAEMELRTEQAVKERLASVENAQRDERLRHEKEVQDLKVSEGGGTGSHGRSGGRARRGIWSRDQQSARWDNGAESEYFFLSIRGTDLLLWQLDDERAALKEEKAELEKLVAQVTAPRARFGPLEDEPSTPPPPKRGDSVIIEKFSEQQSEALAAIEQKFMTEILAMREGVLGSQRVDGLGTRKIFEETELMNPPHPPPPLPGDHNRKTHDRESLESRLALATTQLQTLQRALADEHDRSAARERQLASDSDRRWAAEIARLERMSEDARRAAVADVEEKLRRDRDRDREAAARPPIAPVDKQADTIVNNMKAMLRHLSAADVNGPLAPPQVSVTEEAAPISPKQAEVPETRDEDPWERLMTLMRDHT
ncbi:Iguana/Dzip1-like DAZ-interacting protein N-terminal-domain-containing protein, partial [Blyttiomyces helicus]